MYTDNNLPTVQITKSDCYRLKYISTMINVTDHTKYRHQLLSTVLITNNNCYRPHKLPNRNVTGCTNYRQ